MNYLKKIFNKQIISGILLFFIFFTTSFALFPAKKAEAQWTDFSNLAVNTVNLVKNTISSISTVATKISTYLMKYKEFVLDPLAWAFAKAVISQITASVVDWINSGFEGSPAFVQDPGAFFLDVADQMTGEFVAKNLANLCSPFSIDLRIALAFKYHPKNALRRWDCTLSTVIKNSKNAIQNASINGFTAGDFKQGGWPAFVSLTTEPQNNIYGAFLEADSELSLRVAGVELIKKDQLNQGSGFLSFPDPSCVKAANAAAKAANSGESSADWGTDKDSNLVNYDLSTDSYSANKANCPIVTPGSVISSSLSKQLGAGTDTLVTADEISEIVNALLAQLVTQVFSAGLKAVSQKDSSGASYLDQTVKDLNQNTEQVDILKKSMLENMDSDINNTRLYKKNVDDSLSYVTYIISKYNDAKACYTEKINATTTLITQREINIGNAKIQEINNKVSADLLATSTRLVGLAQNAQYGLDRLIKIQDDINASKSISDLGTLSTQYTTLMQGNSIPNEITISDSKVDLDNIQAVYGVLMQDSTDRMNACSGFPENVRRYDTFGKPL